MNRFFFFFFFSQFINYQYVNMVSLNLGLFYSDQPVMFNSTFSPLPSDAFQTWSGILFGNKLLFCQELSFFQALSNSVMFCSNHQEALTLQPQCLQPTIPPIRKIILIFNVILSHSYSDEQNMPRMTNMTTIYSTVRL